MRRVWNPAERQSELMAEVDNLRAEVQRLRSRERRVVRVFWRVREGERVSVFADRGAAFLWAKRGGKVYRVVVRRVAKAGRE